MKKYSLFLFVSLFAFASCVPKRKLRHAESHVKSLQEDSLATHNNLMDCNSRLGNVQGEKTDLQKAMNNLSNSSQATIANSKMTIEQQAKRLQDLQNLIQSQKDVLNRLKKTVADALVNFKPDELSVSIQDGKLYVSLQEKLLFKSGSAVIDPKGKEALQSLATVLNQTPDVSVMIEGHTDNVPISKGKYEDNWSLSTERATSIVRILTNDYKVDAKNITASGRSEFHPIADNSTVDGKAANRRTEIILSPNLSELFKLISQ